MKSHDYLPLEVLFFLLILSYVISFIEMVLYYSTDKLLFLLQAPVQWAAKRRYRRKNIKFCEIGSPNQNDNPESDVSNT